MSHLAVRLHLMLLSSAVFHLNSVGPNIVTLWAAEARLYVGIDDRGNIVTSVSADEYKLTLKNLLTFGTVVLNSRPETSIGDYSGLG